MDANAKPGWVSHHHDARNDAVLGWKPVTEQVAPIAQPTDSRRMPGQTLSTPVIMVLIAVAMVGGVGILAAISADSRSSEIGRETDRIYCQTYPENC